MLRSLTKHAHKLSDVPLFKYLATLVLLFLPFLGMYEAITGLINGPNYFGVRQVSLESVDMYTYRPASGGRFASTTAQEGIYITYRYATDDGSQQTGEMTFSLHNLPVPQYRLKEGASIFLRVPVPKAEGSFGINRDVEQGLAIGGFFGLLAWPLLLLIHSNGNEKRIKSGLLIVKSIYIVLILYVIYLVLQ